MKIHGETSQTPRKKTKTCCGYDDSMDARDVCDSLGIPFYHMDLRTAFQKAVKDNFVQTYLKGQTPNPCVQCNGILKFRVLLQRAKALGCTKLATGHYARVDAEGCLYEAHDLNKDQTYFLHPVTRQALQQTLFPLGDLTKAEVRAHAREKGFVTADKPESQEVCFLPQGKHHEYIAQVTGEDGRGDFVSVEGDVLGQHSGYYRYTIGQRKGIGIASSSPLYVLSIDPDTHQVTVGDPQYLYQSEFEVTDLNWFTKDLPEIAEVRTRHRGEKVSARLSHHGDIVRVQSLQPIRGLTRGQSAVFYDRNRVLGGGYISRVV